MEDSTKVSLTIIILAIIWFMAQPMSGNVSMEAKLDKVPYFNLTNSTVDVHANISGTMPAGMTIPMIIADMASPFSEKNFILVLNLVALIFVTSVAIMTIYVIYLKVKDYKNRRNQDGKNN